MSMETVAMRNMALSKAQKTVMLDATAYGHIGGNPVVIRKLVELKLARGIHEYGRCAHLTIAAIKMLPDDHRARKMYERNPGLWNGCE